MGHGHAHHHHAHNEARTLIAAGLTGSFMLAEVVGGVLFGSLALLASYMPVKSGWTLYGLRKRLFSD